MTTTRGVDYTVQTTPERAKQLAEEGYTFVCRYLVPEAYAWKRLTPDEAKVLSDAGLNIVSVFEASADRAAGGAAAGKPDGQAALAEAKRVGQPLGTAIYFAVDFDAQPKHYDAIERYLRAAAAEITGYRIGVYGSYTVCVEMYHRGAAQHVWQTYAWSGGKFTSHANLYQYKNGQSVAGVQSDLNNGFGGEGWWSLRPKALPVIQRSATVEAADGSSEGYLIDNTVYVPLRDVTELLGSRVSWDNQTKTATITK